MASKVKKPAPVVGRSVEDQRSIRKQILWIVGIFGSLILLFLVFRWGQDSGWGDPDRAVKARFAKGEHAFVEGRFDLAAEQYAAVVKHFPKHPQANQALTQLASAYQGEGKLDLAQDALKQLVQRLEAANDHSDLHAYTLLQLGKLQKERLDPTGAISTLERVRAEHPKTDWSGEALNTIAQVHQAAKQYELARQSFGQLIKELPGGFLAAEAQSGIGECYEAEGQTRAAIKAYQVVLDKYPSAVWETAKTRIETLKKELEKPKPTSKR